MDNFNEEEEFNALFTTLIEFDGNLYRVINEMVFEFNHQIERLKQNEISFSGLDRESFDKLYGHFLERKNDRI